YNSSGWAMLNGTADNSTHTLSLANMDPASIYGILQYNASNCPVIVENGTYSMSSNFTGAPNNASEIAANAYACVKIAASNVTFDCAGYSITGTGSPGSAQYGILLNGSLSNVTVRNCPAVSNYTNGIHIYQSNSSLFTNISAFNNTNSGFYVDTGSNNSFIGNLAYNNTWEGFEIYADNNSFTNNTAYDNADGFYGDTASNNTFTNNMARNNLYSGFSFSDNPYNVFINNTAYSNNASGFDITTGAYNHLGGNLAYNNTDAGFGIFGGSDNSTLENNSAYNNSAYGNDYGVYSYHEMLDSYLGNSAYNNTITGIYDYSSKNLTVRDNVAFNNSVNGLEAGATANSTFANNSAHNNTYAGFYAINAIGNMFANNSAYSNNESGFALSYSQNNSLVNGTAYGNTLYGIRLSGSNNTLVYLSLSYGNGYGAYLEGANYANFTASNLTNNTNDGLRMDNASAFNSLGSNYVCFNGLDVNNQGASNAGAADRCDSFLSWTEGGHFGCEFSCSTMWHRFFGNVNSTIILKDNSSAGAFFSWNSTGFAVYFADYDSDVSWHDLQAIGKNSANASSASDFTELDAAFSTASFGDNINRTYSSDGSAPLESRNFTVFGRLVADVPIANSTASNTTFDTGILWDMSDDTGGGEYDAVDKESTVWTVAVNSSTTDVYGTYDYLVQIPSTLSTYEGGNDIVSVYVELQ
ncbi:right-handed parallel beta-helix repeat-containing protein, partial [Candidatus Micrarchaeota archaeon]|nr:right-handed parallel beta-helix repeat-containing protein [Candidatus Micrarchaeota archaeon]